MSEKVGEPGDLTPKEVCKVFEVVRMGGGLQETKKALPERDKKTRSAIYKVARVLHERRISGAPGLSVKEAEDLAENLPYGVTAKKILEVHFQYGAWRDRISEAQVNPKQDIRHAVIKQHADELCAFAEELRAHIGVPMPVDIVAGMNGGFPFHLGVWVWESTKVLLDMESHPYFPCVRQRLALHPFWATLGELTDGLATYGQTCRIKWKLIRGLVGAKLPAIPHVYQEAVTSWLLADSFSLERGYLGVESDYAAQEEPDENGANRFRISLGSWSVLCATEEDANAVGQILAVLRQEVKRKGVAREVAKRYQTLVAAAGTLQTQLLPASIRGIMLNGRCEHDS